MSQTLAELLLQDRSKRPAILRDCERFIDDEVNRKKGLTGVALKGGYKVVCKVKPGIIREAMDSLLDEFVGRLEPLFTRHVEGGGEPAAFATFLDRHADEAADLLLGVTDERAARAKNKTLKSAYQKLRGQAKKHVVEAIPGAGRMFVKHL